MEKRFFLTLVAVMLFSILFWFVLYPGKFPVEKKRGEPKRKETQEPASKAPEALPGEGELERPRAEEKGSEGKAGEFEGAGSGEEFLQFPAIKGKEKRDFFLDTKFCRFSFTNQGGCLTGLRFKQEFIQAKLTEEEKREERFWYELISPFHEKGGSFLLQDVASEESLRLPLDTEFWEVLESEEKGEKVITFEYAPGNGLRFTKRFFFLPDAYAWRFQLSLFNENPSLEGKEEYYLIQGPSGIVEEGTGRTFVQPLALAANGKEEGALRLSSPVLESAVSPTSKVSLPKEDLIWVGLKNKYFLFILKPVEKGNGIELDGLEVTALPNQQAYNKILEAWKNQSRGVDPKAEAMAKRDAGQRLVTDVSLKVRVPAGSGEVHWHSQVFSGPKDRKLFRGQFKTLEKIVDYDLQATSCGFGIIILPFSKFMMLLLDGIYAVVKNYGVGIILLTLLVKVVLFPLMRKQQTSMQKYQKQIEKLKPRLEELKAKYKNNKRKFNEEQWKLMKEHGVQPIPLGGCLPMFITLPIFIALFSLLNSSYELRHAPFMLWINDLSAPDALVQFSRPIIILPGLLELHNINLLPILMMVAWYLQQKMAPKAADPQAQQTQKMMMIMPFLFGVVLYDYASGLSLYWLTNSVFGIIEQKFIRKSLQQQKLDEPSSRPTGARS